MLKRIVALAAVGAMTLAASTASAQVTYSFIGSGDTAGVTFTFTQPGFVTNAQNVSSFTGKSGGISSIDFCFQGQFGGNCYFSSPDVSYLGLNFGGSSAYIAYDGNPFRTDGVFNASSESGNPGTLTIAGTPASTVVPVTSAVPEAATWAMMIVGMGVVGGALRRRQKVNARVSFA